MSNLATGSSEAQLLEILTFIRQELIGCSSLHTLKDCFIQLQNGFIEHFVGLLNALKLSTLPTWLKLQQN